MLVAKYSAYGTYLGPAVEKALLANQPGDSLLVKFQAGRYCRAMAEKETASPLRHEQRPKSGAQDRESAQGEEIPRYQIGRESAFQHGDHAQPQQRKGDTRHDLGRISRLRAVR